MEVITVGVLGLQGGFAEHLTALTKLQSQFTQQIVAQTVKTPEDLALCDALIIPGGESTTIALLAKLSGLLGPLREFVRTKPVWGTCAGAILLSREVMGSKKGGQEVFGGMDVRVGRNGWGSQVESFEADLAVKGMKRPETPFKGVFIRAPVVLALLAPSDSRPPLEIIARLPEEVIPSPEVSPYPAAFLQEPDAGSLPTPPNERVPVEDLRHIVAVKQGRHLLTTFHPELTRDDRFHELFVRSCVLAS